MIRGWEPWSHDQRVTGYQQLLSRLGTLLSATVSSLLSMAKANSHLPNVQWGRLKLTYFPVYTARDAWAPTCILWGQRGTLCPEPDRAACRSRSGRVCSARGAGEAAVAVPPVALHAT